MSNTYSSLYIQIVFAVKNREKLLHSSWRENIFKYMSGIINAKGHKAYIINGVEDHVHILMSIKPGTSISELVRDIKNNSTNYIKDHKWTRFQFSWQEGFGAFSYSQKDVDKVYKYIQNQEAHHKQIDFKSEYVRFLTEYNIEYNDKYL
jgi:putative transposase